MDKVLQDSRLHPVVRDMALRLQERVFEVHGIKILYCQGFRTSDYQANLFAQGRTRPGKIVTNCRPGYSPHNYGLAVDFVPIVNGKAAWNRTDLFDIVGREAIAMGFCWGGNFRSFVDKPHLENMFGLKISDLLAGKRPPKPEEKGGPEMNREDAEKVIGILGAAWTLGKAAGMSQAQLDEIHRLTDEVRKAGGLPVQ